MKSQLKIELIYYFNNEIVILFGNTPVGTNYKN